MTNKFISPLQVHRLPPSFCELCPEMFAPRGEKHPVGLELCIIFCNQGNISQFSRFAHLVEPVSEVF